MPLLFKLVLVGGSVSCDRNVETNELLLLLYLFSISRQVSQCGSDMTHVFIFMFLLLLWYLLGCQGHPHIH